jgi:GMP synthase-like glutamine amidotransferase
LPEPEVGFVEVLPTDEGKRDRVVSHIKGLDGILAWHEDSFTLPNEATLLASSSAVQNQAFKFGSARGIQFHIEVTEREITSWADETDPDELRAWWGIDKEQLLERAGEYLPAQAAAAKRMTEEFVSLL